MDIKKADDDALLEVVRQQLRQSVARLQDLKGRPENELAHKQALEHELVAVLSAVGELLPPDLQAQVQQLLVLHAGLSNPYLGRATSMTQLHQRNGQRSDLPSWAQPE
ncbi:hypothetical protein [Dictyobacter kobayashii]|uniref:Uncharacterized protein n=1 Tax=Dictyobacter kobayashii TaxID=2014872 RepID=A0A402AY91_9CHLR|nr:hypothetical protein [Dictyobacter kobayashii]GCE24091.1 hypothetical protein KDK_78910 [Dictyobacter kobayashii]